MQSEREAITTALTAARARLDAHLQNVTIASPGHAALTLARDQLDAALATLDQAARTMLPQLAAPALLDQIVLLPPSASDAFRTKVKLKPAEQRTAAVLPVEAVAPDDLTRIRGIDASTARALAGLGIKAFDAIAGWGQADVQRVSEALGLGRTISRQNWIEQAALLRRAQLGSLPVNRHQQVQPPVAVQPMVPPVELAPTMAVAVVRLVQADALGLIKGLSASHHALLQAGGVRRWAEIAAWRRDDITHWQAVLGRDAPITKAGWIEQAALLTAGGTTRFAREQVRGFNASLVPQPLLKALPMPIFAPWATDAPMPEPVPVVMPVTVAPPELVKIVNNDPLEEPPLLEAPVEGAAPSIAASNDATAIDLPTALDRVAALEFELASLVANDRARQVPATTIVEHPPVQGHPSAPRLNIEDEEFLELNVSEADVVIVPRNKPGPVVAPQATEAISTRTLLARMRRVPPIDDIEADRYAAYRDRAEEASVEIIRAGGSRAESASADRVAQPTPPERPITRLLRNFKRQD